MLTDNFINRVKPEKKAKKYADSNGLYLYVAPSGSKFWRINYTFAGKNKTLSIGRYPDINAEKARNIKDKVKNYLSSQIDPSQHIDELRKVKTSLSFKEISETWFEERTSEMTERRRIFIQNCLSKYFYPVLGEFQIESIESSVILRIIKDIERDGKIALAHEVLQLIKRIYRYAVSHQYIDQNIIASITGAIRPLRRKHRAALLDHKAFGILLQDIDVYKGDISIQYALRIMPHVFVRAIELTDATWDEFDFSYNEWRIPAYRMKERQEHIVPLSNFVKNELLALREITGHQKYVFPSMVNKNESIRPGSLLYALRNLGYKNTEMCVHGFRSVASTYLNEQGYNRDWIERQLSHKPKDAVRASYNHALYLDGRRKMMEEWSCFLLRLKGGDRDRSGYGARYKAAIESPIEI